MVETSVEARNWLINRLQEGGLDVLRGLAEAMIHALMNSEADAICGARYGERSPDRVNHRNGYRERQLDTRLGTLELQVPKLREGSYFPGWILEPRRRIEKALVAVVAECYVAGVSTRKVEQVVQTLGIEGISKSQVSEMARSLDAQVEAFRNRPLDRGPYRYVWLDALVVRCRELGRIVNVAVVVGTGINKEGSKEVLGVDVITSEDGAGWVAFLRTPVGRGLSGVELVISDAHVSELMQRDAVGPAQKERAESLCATADHMMSVVNDILELSRIEANRVVLEHRDFSLAEALDSAVAAIREPARAKGLRIGVEIPAELRDVVLRGDRLRLRQVLINLLSNAVKFTAKGSVTVSVGRLGGDGPVPTFGFTVTDTGIGISPGDRSRIFRAFEQVGGATARTQGGQWTRPGHLRRARDVLEADKVVNIPIAKHRTLAGITLGLRT